MHGPATPTRRRMHPSPSSPAWTAWGIGTPCGRTRYAWASHSHTAEDAPKSPQSCLGRFGDRDAKYENEVCTGRNHSHKAADTPESLRSCLGRFGDRDARWDNKVCTGRNNSH